MVKSIPYESAFDLSSLRAFIRQRVLPGTKQRDLHGQFPEGLFRDLHSMGWLEPFIPAELGGSGATTIDMIHIAREVAYGSPGMATSMAGNMLAATPILRHGTQELREQFCKDVLGNFRLSSFCFTEPDAGSDILSISTKAVRVPGGYRLSGKKCFITNANYASHFVVVAKVEGISHPRKAMTVFYVPARAEGVSVGQAYDKLGHRESNTSEVFFENVFIPESHRIGDEGMGLSVAVQSLEKSRSFLAAAAVGLCDRAGDLVKENLGSRIRCGKLLLSQPPVQTFLAQLYTEAQAAWLLTCHASAEWDSENHSELKYSSMAKLYAGQIAEKFASGALELFGGWGFVKEFEVERLYRDSKLFQIIEGPTFVQQLIIAKELFPKMQEHGTEALRKVA